MNEQNGNEQNNYVDDSQQTVSVMPEVQQTAEPQLQYQAQEPVQPQPQYQVQEPIQPQPTNETQLLFASQPQYQPQEPIQPQYQPQEPIQPQEPKRPLRWYHTYKVLSLIFGIAGSFVVLFLAFFAVAVTIADPVEVSGYTAELAASGINIYSVIEAIRIFVYASVGIALVSVIISYMIFGGLNARRRIGLGAVRIQAVWYTLVPLLEAGLLFFLINEAYSLTLDILKFYKIVGFILPTIDAIFWIFAALGVAGALVHASIFMFNVKYFNKRKNVFK